MIKIAPSILSADFSNLARDIAKVEAGGADMLHFDVMDGVFVPNLAIGPQIIRSVRANTKLIFDVHLMVAAPEKYIENFIEAGADSITFHLEAADNVFGIINLIKKSGAKACISIKTQTPVGSVSKLLSQLDMVLVMSVEPGMGSHCFIPESIQRIATMSELIKTENPYCKLEVDGGINIDNINKVVNAGANIIVAGDAIFKSANAVEAIANLKDKCKGN